EKRSPRLAIIVRVIYIGREVAKSVAIKSNIGCAGIEVTRLNPAYPRILRQAANVSNHVIPGLTAIPGELKIAIVRPGPDEQLVLGRFADRINGGMHFRLGVIDRYSARLLLLLLLGVVCCQVRRNALPGLAV